MSQHDAITIAVIDCDGGQRQKIALALRPYYRVSDFPDLETAFGTMRQRPSLVVVDEAVRPGQRRDLIRTLKEEPSLAGVPVALCKTPGRTAEYGITIETAPDATIEKPIRRKAMVATISAVLNGKVEAGWDALPKASRQTLRESLKAFGTFAGLVAGGEFLKFGSLDAICAPLIEAVGQSEHKYILDGLKGHDNITYVHSLRVATLLSLFGHGIGLKEESLVILSAAGMVHDLGKLEIPAEYRNRDDDLDDEHLAAMRGHVDSTIAYLKKHSDVPKGVVIIAGQHHERIDGSGYPKGLKGSEINDLARMGAIVDVFAGLTEGRGSRAALSSEKALARMTEEMAAGLDTRLVGLFRQIVLDNAL